MTTPVIRGDSTVLHPRSSIWVVMPLAVLASYFAIYAAYALCNQVPTERLHPRFLERYSGAVCYPNWRAPGGLIVWYGFHPAAFVTWHLFGIDCEWHQGDSFGYYFCEDDFID